MEGNELCTGSLCEGAQNYCEGFIGSKYNQGLFFLLHIADHRAVDKDYKDALFRTNTGGILERILQGLSLDVEKVIISNLVKCIFSKVDVVHTNIGSFNSKKDNYPVADVYGKCHQVLDRQLNMRDPKVLVAFGARNFSQLYEGKIDEELQFEWRLKGVKSTYKGVPVFYSVHPSMIWAFRNEEKISNYIKGIVEFIAKQGVGSINKDMFYSKQRQLKLF